VTHAPHEYAARLIWDGNNGHGTETYAGYGREYRVIISGKADLTGSADAMFKGSAGLHNPEDFFLAAISSCHLLSYLALCAQHGVSVLAYEDDARGTLVFTPDGGGRFETVTLHPNVTIADSGQIALAQQLHTAAHKLCYVASSCSVPIHHEATVHAGSK
jgi:organic hydroperoxide reductase OsmC/OhrA